MSPLTRTSAWPFTAASRNLSSRGSRHLNLLHNLDDIDERREPQQERITLFARHVAVELGRQQLANQFS